MKATSAMSSRASPMGFPASSDSSRARRSCSRRTMSAALRRIRPRCRAAVPGHHAPSSKVRRAAPTAASTSAGLECGAVAITAPVAGLNTSKRSPSCASTHFPSMKFCSASAMGAVPYDLGERPDLAVVPLRLLLEEGAVLQVHLVLLRVVRVGVVRRAVLEDREQPDVVAVVLHQHVRRDIALRVGGLLVEDRSHRLPVLGLDHHPCARSVHRSPFVGRPRAYAAGVERGTPPKPGPLYHGRRMDERWFDV